MKQIFKCDEACAICDKAQYNEARFIDKLRLILHLISCKSCRDYVRNNRKLTKKVQSEIGELTPDAKAEMQRKIDAEINGNSRLQSN